jgi:hypothetical protein
MSDMYKEIMGEIRLNWDDHDPFGSVQEWRFAICEVLAFDCDHWVPGFRTVASEPEPDNWAVDALRYYQPEGIRDNDWPHDMWSMYATYIEALTDALVILDRLRSWCDVWGRTY